MDGAVIDVMNSGLQELLNGTMTPEKLAADIQAVQNMVGK
jgi:raffinose/stachyose/melibiose transport system substrate-binding protein